jgi:hypothetical protein
MPAQQQLSAITASQVTSGALASSTASTQAE